jgi:hypothetical protein
MKNSVPLLADLINTSRQQNGQNQPTLRARMNYGARLRRAVQSEEDQIIRMFRLATLRRNRSGSRLRE